MTREKSEFVPGERSVAPSDKMDFDCQCCGGCCTYTTPYVSPLDVWNLARHLGVATSDVLEHNLVIGEDWVTRPGRVVPLLRLEMAEPTGQCRFLDPLTTRCRVHPARPLSCRLFPAGLRHVHQDDGSLVDRLIRVEPLPECTGYGKGRNTVGEYAGIALIGDQAEHSRDFAAFCDEVFGQNAGLAADPDFADAFLGALFDLDSRPGGDFGEKYEAAKRLVRSWLA